MACIRRTNRAKPRPPHEKANTAAYWEQNRLLDAALANMPYGLCMWDRQHRITICNERYLDIYGFSRKIVGSGTPMLEMFEHWVALGGGGGKHADGLLPARQHRHRG